DASARPAIPTSPALLPSERGSPANPVKDIAGILVQAISSKGGDVAMLATKNLPRPLLNFLDHRARGELVLRIGLTPQMEGDIWDSSGHGGIPLLTGVALVVEGTGPCQEG